MNYRGYWTGGPGWESYVVPMRFYRIPVIPFPWEYVPTE
jgi:hypothetical protein